jgi:hypothetical protein
MELQIQDIQVAAQIIDLAVQRGAFKANEVKIVGETFEKISTFLAAVAKQQEEAKAAEAANAPADGTVPATEPATETSVTSVDAASVLPN